MIKLNKYAAWSVLLATSIFVVACQSHFDVVQANRKQYAINNELAADSSIIRSYLPYKLKMDAQMNAIIGRSDIQLTKGGKEGSLLGNFFADASLTEAKNLDSTIDFAMPSTNGGLRNSLPKGDISLSNVFELMPFENELLVLKLKGSDVQELIRFIASSGGQPIAGMTLKIEDKKASDVKINGQSFDPNKTYQVLTSDYIAGGGDGALGMSNPLERKVLGLKVRDALIQYIKTQTAAGKTITAKLDGRITKN